MGNGRSKLHSGVSTSSTSSSSTSSGSYNGVNRNGSETTFTDTSEHTFMPSHDFDYNADIVRYFGDNSNIEQLIPLMSNAERNDWDRWARGAFMGSATYYYALLDQYQQQMLKTYDKYIDKSSFNEDIAVRTLAGYSILTGSRSVPSDAEWANIVNQPIKLDMPMSSAAAAHGLTIGSSGKNVEYVWHIPKNVKGVAMPLVDGRINREWKERQREVIMGRDNYWKPTKRNFNKKRGVWEIHMSYIGKDKHDYSTKLR